MTPEQFLEALKSPEQVKMKQHIIEILKNPECQVLNVDYMQYHPDDYRAIISITVNTK